MQTIAVMKIGPSKCGARLAAYAIPPAMLTSLATGNSIQKAEDLQLTKGFLDIPVRYKEVPDGVCELTPGVKTYSGYVDIEDNQHIFWTLFEARERDLEEAPLTVWLSGGPGGSSMDGREEIGPCGVDFEGNLYNRPYSWR